MEAVEDVENPADGESAFADEAGLVLLPAFLGLAAWFGAVGGFWLFNVAAGGEADAADDAVGAGDFDLPAMDDEAGVEIADGEPFAVWIVRGDGKGDVGVVEGDRAEEVASVDESGDIDIEADAVDVDEALGRVEEVEESDVACCEAIDWVEGEAADFGAESEWFEFAFDEGAPAAVESDVVGVEGEGREAADEEEGEVEAESAAADARAHGVVSGASVQGCQGRKRFRAGRGMQRSGVADRKGAGWQFLDFGFRGYC